MSDINVNETWQIDVNGHIYDATFEDLSHWIAEGSLVHEDRVRCGQLRWMEAWKVPALRAFFNARKEDNSSQIIVSTNTPPALAARVPTTQFTNAGPSGTIEEPVPPKNTGNVEVPTPAANAAVNAALCRNHGERASKFICLSCTSAFCRDCVNVYSSNVAVCNACGGMCKSRSDTEAALRANELRNRCIQDGFGFADFREAIAYPFKFKPSLIFGSLMFMFFSLGQSSFSMGGIFMISASLLSYALANMLAFGVLSNTMENFAQGKLDRNFMPDFDDFSLWDDVVHPFFLSIGAYVSSFGVFIVILLIGMYLVMSSVSTQVDAVKTKLETTPGTPYYNVRDTVDQSEQVKQVLGNSERANNERVGLQDQIARSGPPSTTERSDPDHLKQIQSTIAQSRRNELEAAMGISVETRGIENAAMISGLLQLSPPLVVVGFIALICGLFYFPAACMVAGYTRSFTAALDPSVGLDTVKRMGFDYVKVLAMGLILLTALGVFGLAAAAIFSPFDLPGIGNIPAKALFSLFLFYVTAVFACVLGHALFKASNRLRLPR